MLGADAVGDGAVSMMPELVGSAVTQ